jgi:eukaryotic-like serine/threonine-protein kinase
VLKFITHRALWVNIVVGLLLAVGVFLAFVLSLNWCTHHGKSTNVPAVLGKTIDEAREVLRSKGFDVEIQDSLYVDTLGPLTVIKQTPDADEIVKESRTVYLVINRAEPPLEEMPNLVDYTFRNAEMVLKARGLRIGDTTYKPDFAFNTVLEQWHKGSQIAPGTKIRRGSVVTLVLGNGVGKKEYAVPNLIGMRFCDAKAVLGAHGIGFGVVMLSDVTDTCNSFIYWQNPSRYDEDKKIQHIRSGQLMDVKLQVDKPVRDSTLLNALPDGQDPLEENIPNNY